MFAVENLTFCKAAFAATELVTSPHYIELTIGECRASAADSAARPRN